jgi:hypothetical protein
MTRSTVQYNVHFSNYKKRIKTKYIKTPIVWNPMSQHSRVQHTNWHMLEIEFQKERKTRAREKRVAAASADPNDTKSRFHLMISS